VDEKRGQAAYVLPDWAGRMASFFTVIAAPRPTAVPSHGTLPPPWHAGIARHGAV